MLYIMQGHMNLHIYILNVSHPNHPYCNGLGYMKANAFSSCVS